MTVQNTEKPVPAVTVHCSDAWQAKVETAAAEFLGRLAA